MLPPQLIKSLQGIQGFDETAFLQVHASGEKVTSMRLNPLKPVNGKWSMINEATDVPWCKYGKYLSERPSFILDPLLHGGAYYVQEASSMFLWHVLDQTVGTQKELKVLDLCAAPGGKSTLLASYFTEGLLVSNEVIKSRGAVLVENMAKWGSDNVIVTNNDPKNFATLEGYFDVIVADAPCSGSGLFRKNTDAINEWSEDNVLLCSQRQQRILADVYPALKKDGILIYATCSYSYEEDEAILLFIKQHFNVSSLRLSVQPDWNITETCSDEMYGYRFYPDKVKGEGFFIAAFKKNEGVKIDFYEQPLPSISKVESAIVNEWLKHAEGYFYFKQSENIIAFPAKWKTDLAILQKKLYLRKAGVTIGELKGKDMVPNHELALSLLMSGNIANIDVSKDRALQYLKKKEIQIENSPKGWLVLTYCGVRIGWVKVLHNRINNYYPLNWRILKE